MSFKKPALVMELKLVVCFVFFFSKLTSQCKPKSAPCSYFSSFEMNDPSSSAESAALHRHCGLFVCLGVVFACLFFIETE